MRWERGSFSRWRLLVAAAGALLAGTAMMPGGEASASGCAAGAEGAGPAGQSPLRFGIYPGGPAGSVNPKAPPRPEDPAKRLAALRGLAGSQPFVVRLYSGWTGNAAADDVSGWLDDEIAGYTAAGLQVELVVRYKPAAPDAGSAPTAFAGYVRSIVRRYGPDPRFVSLQVTNEANIPAAAEASDGAFAGAAEALVKGVIAAKQQALQSGHGRLSVGFNWAHDERPQAAGEFWTTLGRLGGRAFANAVDWVGLDSYPGTWMPQIALSNLLPGLAAGALQESVRSLRECFMPLAGLGGSTMVHIAENGFPTGPGRSEALQSDVLESMVAGVHSISARYGVSDYRWFDLRDSASGDPSVESQYGIMRDDYSPKAAFGVYRDLIARHGADGAGPGGSVVASTARCRTSPVDVTIPRWKTKHLRSLVVFVAGKVAKRVRGPLIPRAVRISMRSGVWAVRLRLTATAHGRQRTRERRRTYRIC